MKRFLSVILAVVLVTAVSGSFIRGTVAGFSDVEVSTENWMCAGSRILELSGDPLVVHNAWPCCWYSQEYILINAGTLDGIAYIHIPKIDDPGGKWAGLKCFEDGTLEGLVFDGMGYRLPVGSEPIGTGVATSEPELVAEEGGCVGEMADGTPVYVTGLGVDKCNICDYIDVTIYFEGQPVVSGKLSEIACTPWPLGVVPASPSLNYPNKGGGWGSYFTYHVDSETKVVPLVAGKTILVGTVTIWNDATNLYIRYDTNGWKMEETHVYVGTSPPLSLAPGQFPYKHENLGGVTTDSYTIPLSQIGAGKCQDVYIAAHASNRDTAWAQGEGRKVRVELHFPDIDEDDLNLDYFNDSIPAEAKWDHWPTNAYQGDSCTFDMVFKLEKDSNSINWWRPRR